MAERVLERITEDEYFALGLDREERFELVDGLPLMMAPASRRHGFLCANAVVALGLRLRGKRCHVLVGQSACRIPNGNFRMPDFLVECEPLEPKGAKQEYSDPRLVAEVLSPSTRAYDRVRKVREYKSVPAIHLILLIDPDAPRVMLSRREAGDVWVESEYEGLDAIVPLPEIEADLPLAELYEGLFPA